MRIFTQSHFLRAFSLIVALLFSSSGLATYADYAFSDQGPFYNFDIYMKWDHDVSSSTGIYQAFQFGFQNGQGGYMGMQSDSTGKHAIFSIWDDVDGSMSAVGAAPCDRFGGEGVGARCLINYSWIAGREYRLRIWVLDYVNNTERWVGAIQDTVTQIETTIGIISLRDSKGYSGYGWLKNTPSVFLERYISNPSGGCASQPDAKVTWRGPYADSNTATANKAVASFAHYSTSCPNTNVWSTGVPFVSAEDGASTQRTTPEYANIWSATVGYALTVSTSGSGSISSAPAGIACGSTCSATFNSGTSVILTATPASGNRFTGWGGACTGTATTCTLSMTAAKSVTASFIVTTLAPYTDNGDGTVTDPRTGLIWMRCAMGQTWTGSTCGGTATAYTWAAAVALTGATSFASKSDWRLPNIRELQTIVDRSTLRTAVFPNTPPTHFWSASSNTANSANAWFVYLNEGSSSADGKINVFSVRLVRSGQSLGLLNPARPTIDYVDQHNGTTMHTPSGLMWKRCAEGQSWSGSTCTGTARTYTWAAAQGLNSPFAGQSDWRLPTAEELLSLADYTISSPAINAALFPSTGLSFFWSASSYTPNSTDTWTVYFYDGDPYANGQSYVYARLVRTAPAISTFALTVSTSGSGSISSAPAGIACGSTCSTTFNSGTSAILTATPASGNRFTGWGGACAGTSATCTLTMNAAQSVTASFSSLASQSIAFGAAPSIVVGGTGRASATASSGLLVAFSSLSAGICTVSGSTVTGVAVGTCTLAANQAGNSSISPAPQVTLSFSITALPFDPPTMSPITAGSGSATIYFSPPSNTGGSPISSYTATCTASGQTTRTATGTASPITVKNLTGGVIYQCWLTATNSAGLTSNPSAALPVTPRKKSNLTPILMLLLD